MIYLIIYVLKANILISAAGQPLLTDFGLSRQLIASKSGGSSTSEELAGSLPWMAPEFFHNSHQNLPAVKPNLKTDIWAYGMTVLVSISESMYATASQFLIGLYISRNYLLGTSRIKALERARYSGNLQIIHYQ